MQGHPPLDTPPAPDCCRTRSLRWNSFSPARPRPVGRRRLPDLGFPGDATVTGFRLRATFLTRLIADVEGHRRLSCSGDLWNEPGPTSPCSGTGRSRRPLELRLAPTSGWGRVPLAADRPAAELRCVPSTGGTRSGTPTSTTPRPTTWCPTSSAGTPCRVTRGQRRGGQHHAELRGIAHPRPYQINAVRGLQRAEPRRRGLVHRPPGARPAPTACAPTGRAAATCTTDLGIPAGAQLLGGQYQPKGEWWVYRFYGSQTGQIVSVTPSAPTTTPSPPRPPARPRSWSAAAPQPATSPSTCSAWTPPAASCRTTRCGSSPSASLQRQRRGHGAGHRPELRGDPVGQRHDGQPAAQLHRRHLHHHLAAALGRSRQRVDVGACATSTPAAAWTSRASPPPTAPSSSLLGLRHRLQPAVDPDLLQAAPGCAATSAWTPPGRWHRQRHLGDHLGLHAALDAAREGAAKLGSRRRS